MKRRQLEILLSGLEGFSSPSPYLEQYPTPAPLAADLLYTAWMRGELDHVVDLGCGTGVLTVGAALLNSKAIGIDIDRNALAAARRNAYNLGVYVDFVLADVGRISLRPVKTVIMNPPFGAQKTSPGDRAFLKKASQIAGVIYSIHNAGSEGFIKRIVEPCKIEEISRASLPIKRCFDFHRKDVRTFEVELYRIVCKKHLKGL